MSSIDFKRGDGAPAKLILRFSGDGAAPDMRNMGGNVVVDIGNAQLPAALQRPINVGDFATPVQRIDAHATSSGAQLVLGTRGAFESMAYQSGNEYIVEIVPRATLVAGEGWPRPSAPPGVGATSSDATVRYSGKPVTFNFQDVPVRHRPPADRRRVEPQHRRRGHRAGNVTLRLMNVPWDQGARHRVAGQVARQAAQRQRGLGRSAKRKPRTSAGRQRKTRGINLEERAEKVTEYIPVNYGSAEDIARLLTEESKGNTVSNGGQGGQSNMDRGFLSQRAAASATTSAPTPCW